MSVEKTLCCLYDKKNQFSKPTKLYVIESNNIPSVN